MSERKAEIREAGAPRPILELWFATAGGVGYAPVAPGTFGSAVGVLLFVPLSQLPVPLFALAVIGLMSLGVWSSDGAERALGRTDDGRIVIDEVVGQLIALSPLLIWTGAARSLALLGAGFLTFRVLDIWKPGPIRWAEKNFSGGAGVMMDDVAAGALSALVVAPVAILCGAPAGAA